MTELNDQLGAIDLERPFAEQEAIQNFLAPTINPISENITDEVLRLFLEIVESFAQREFVSESLQAIKIGYEKAVVMSSGLDEYRIESRFISNQNWRSQYDLEILCKKEVFFLCEDLQEPRDRVNEAISGRDATQVKKLGSRLSNELLRLYPKLQECREFHFYIFIKPVVKLSSLDEEGFTIASTDERYQEDIMHVAQTCNEKCDGKVYKAEKNGSCQACPNSPG